jgi:[glutamine synthetase] adenylyltransferase / [glutamine synthetase]-adenylyl-L-tyrosine phosphorylase
MTFETQIKQAPIAYESELGEETAKACGLESGKLYDLIAGTAGCSPYLRGLIQKENDWLTGVWGADPEPVFQSVLDGVNPENLSASLRQAKRRVALLTALCDLGGIWCLEQVTDALTRFADFAVQAALHHHVKAEIKRGKLPAEAGNNCAGIFVLAMGKMGAFELNYSSDIDLICFFDDNRYALEDLAEVRPHLIRIIQRMCKTLSDVTADGYVFRTDVRLRPNPSVTPVCISATAAMNYYESEGRTWERAAFIKARPAAGDITAGEQFLAALTPFVWRRHLDFAAIEDAHDMRLRIRSHKGLSGEIKLEGHNLKLGRGGIREIEFFAQTRQMIAGGRDHTLRDRRTVESLRALSDSGWIDGAVADQLVAAYRMHRTHEHRIQMIGDVQTHDLPGSSGEMDRFARLCGSADTDKLKAEIRTRLQSVHDIIEAFFAPDAVEDSQNADYEKTFATWETLPAFRSTRATDIFQRLKPQIIKGIDAAENPSEALSHFETFLRGLPSGVQVFSLFDTNPPILELVLDIVTTAPSLATYLARHSNVLDAVLSGEFFQPLPDKETLVCDLQALLAASNDYEDQLNITRRWQKELHFRLGVLQLRNIADAFEASLAYSELAQACLIALLPAVQAEFARKHGKIPGSGLAILAMGKLGSNEMTATSDLDLIVIYDPAGQDGSDGERPLATVQYYARLTQALVTALSSPTSEGKLYEVDMRLRPSGRKGPVATSVAGFEDYQKNNAWVWEHLALSRACVVAGDADVAAQVMAIRKEVITSEHDRKSVFSEVAKMRARLAENKSRDKSAWEVKEVPGGLLDIELLAQACALVCNILENEPKSQLSKVAELGVVSSDDALHLIRTHSLLSQVQHVSRLLVSGTFDIEDLGKAGLTHILAATGYADKKTLEAALMSKTEDAEAIILRYLSQN